MAGPEMPAPGAVVLDFSAAGRSRGEAEAVPEPAPVHPFDELAAALHGFEAEFGRMNRLTAIVVARHHEVGSTPEQLAALEAWAGGAAAALELTRQTLGATNAILARLA